MSYRLQSGNRRLGGHSELVRLRQQRFMGWDRQVRAVEMSKLPALTSTSECSGSAMRTRARIGRTCSGSSRVPSALQPGGRLVRVPHFRVANSDHMAIGTRPPAQQTQKQYHQHHFTLLHPYRHSWPPSSIHVTLAPAHRRNAYTPGAPVSQAQTRPAPAHSLAQHGPGSASRRSTDSNTSTRQPRALIWR